MANPRHGANDVAALAAIAPKLGDKVVVPGLVECTNPRVEHPRAIAARLVQLAALVGPHRLMAGTDCGFASTASATAITADIAWLKLAALGEGARMASETLYNASAPARCPLIANHATSRVLLIGGTPSSRAELTSSLRASREVVHVLPIDDDVAKDKAALLDTIRWRIDWPILAVGLTPTAAPAVDSICEFVNGGAGDGVARRPATPLMLGNGDDATKEILSMIRSACEFDKRVMGAGGRPLAIDDNVEEEVLDVVVVGAGLLGMYAGNKLADEGMNVAVLERRWVTGGVWSLYANATSQVNSSEGGYSVKEMLPGSTPNRDHSPAQEVLEDLAALGRRLGSDRLRLGVTVTNVARQADGSYVVHVSRAAGGPARLRARGVVLAINDRVGVPRQFVPGNASLNIPTTVKIVPGICDATSSVDSWAGKRVVIYGMGAFAVEAARTALEGGAEKVTVVARRLGTVCPKMVDYSNFVSPWDEDYRHDMSENAATMQRWNRLYAASGAQPPACWPGKIKPEGHTISVSDIWFVAHKMGKLSTHVGTISGLEGGDVVMEDGGRLSADVLIPCIGFLRNTALAESLTGIHQVATSNYLDKHLIYLADAEIDDGAFNFFFGSSVLEYAKFYTSVFIEGLRREGELGHLLWGDTVKRVPLSKRVWSQYIATARRLCQADPRISTIARAQVDARTAHFMATLPPPAYEASNRQEWEDMHTTLNGGVPVPKEKQLPYFLDL
jgi:thioredoxin reductase